MATTIFVILTIIVAVALGFFVLIQNPKGGGLAGEVSGIGNQLMGVQKTTDVLEKATWGSAAIIAVLAITSIFFLKGKNSNDEINKAIKGVTPTATQQTTPSAPGK